MPEPCPNCGQFLTEDHTCPDKCPDCGLSIRKDGTHECKATPLHRDAEGNVWVPCSHCGVLYKPTKRTLKRYRSSAGGGTCSKACQYANYGRRKTIIDRTMGPCPTCGEMFESKYPKTYCKMACWTATAEFKAMMKKNLAKRKLASKPRYWNCLHCGVEMNSRDKNSNQKFCTRDCYRGYMAERFDRRIASPEAISLPQAYDEFLLQEELPCLIEDCDWVGQALSNHMNFSHGWTAAEFKRAAGFNLGTGVVATPMREALRSRSHIHEAKLVRKGVRGNTSGYSSLEGQEHRAKAQALMLTESGPVRTCRQCGQTFEQACKTGKKLYCSLECRGEYTKQKNKKKIAQLVCAHCGDEFLGNRTQERRSQAGKVVVCSMSCRAHLNQNRGQ